jgi:hypothetical protein
LQLGALETVVEALLEIVVACQPSRGSPSDLWHARWTALATETALMGCLTLRPRAFVALGVLEPGFPVRTLRPTLAALSTALTQWNVRLVDSIALCLARALPRLLLSAASSSPDGNTDAAVAAAMLLFWVAVALLQAGDAAVFSSALVLLEATVRTLDRHGAFKGNGGVAPALVAARQALLGLPPSTGADQNGVAEPRMVRLSSASQTSASQLDRMTGVSFAEPRFGVALAVVLLKGFNHPSAPVIAHTGRVLGSVWLAHQANEPQGDDVVSSGKALSPASVGYVAVLFPQSDEVRTACDGTSGRPCVFV